MGRITQEQEAIMAEAKVGTELDLTREQLLRCHVVENYAVGSQQSGIELIEDMEKIYKWVLDGTMPSKANKDFKVIGNENLSRRPNERN
jgi:hypothetical protein